jgi:RimJ/RimL family protein N-acetyltransferase
VESLHKEIFPADELLVEADMPHWILWYKSTPVGFCSVQKITDTHLLFSRAGILKKYRGKGLHRRMISTRLRFAKQHGFRSVVTYTSRGNVASANNLIRSKFMHYVPLNKEEYAGKEFTHFIKDVV